MTEKSDNDNTDGCNDNYDSNEKLWSCGHSKRVDRKQMTSIIISWEPVDGLGTS